MLVNPTIIFLWVYNWINNLEAGFMSWLCQIFLYFLRLNSFGMVSKLFKFQISERLIHGFICNSVGLKTDFLSNYPSFFTFNCFRYGFRVGWISDIWVAVRMRQIVFAKAENVISLIRLNICDYPNVPVRLCWAIR